MAPPRAYRTQTTKPRSTLRFEVALGLGLPLLLIMAGLAVATYLRDRSLIEDQLALSAEQLGGLTLSGLQHAFINHDPETISDILHDLGSTDSIHQVQIVGADGRVAFASRSANVGNLLSPAGKGCVDCHLYPLFARPITKSLDTSEGILHVSMPIQRGPRCIGCHGDGQDALGVLMLDVSMIDVERRLMSDLRTNLLISGAGSLLVSMAAFLLVHAVVVRRIETFGVPLQRFAAGDFSARVPASETETDEIGRLAQTFNNMAASIQLTLQAREARTQVRQQAIVEERARLSRELHDGVGQLLGYVKTKAMAARLMLGRGEHEQAESNLLQLEQAAGELFTDVREAILGLRTNPLGDVGLAAAIQTYSERFSELAELPVEVSIEGRFDEMTISPEAELHLLRVTQEALANVRKHSRAQNAWVTLQWDEPYLRLRIRDDGIGMQPRDPDRDENGHFGMQTMRERAQALGADFTLESGPGQGCSIEVRLNIETESGT